MIVGWRKMSNFRRRNSLRRRRSRGKRRSRRNKTTGYLLFKIRTIHHYQVGRELGRLPQPQHRNVRREGEF